MIQKLLHILFRKNKNPADTAHAEITPRAEHNLSRQDISPNAVKVLYRLHNAGFAAYLVGGGVRDLLLGRKPKDFDVATDAEPEEVKKLFRNCMLIGRRFRIAHVRFGQEIIEVTTFRAHSATFSAGRLHSKLGMLLRDNVYGSIEDDAFRRDFTVNALYYNIADFSVVDFTHGMPDLHTKTLRLIGKPAARYQEDPVRMLRAIRFAAKLQFTLHPDTESPIKKSAKLLTQVPPARLFDEFLKLFMHGHAKNTYLLLEKYELLPYLLPAYPAPLSAEMQAFIIHALTTTDERISNDKPANPAFLLAIFLWPHYLTKLEALKQDRMPGHMAAQKAALFVLNNNYLPMAIPKRLTEVMRDVWALQWRLTSLTRQQTIQAALHKRFRAGYDFLLLRTSAEPDMLDAANWWTHYQEVDHDAQQALLAQLPDAKKHAKKRRPVRRGKNATTEDSLPRTGE